MLKSSSGHRLKLEVEGTHANTYRRLVGEFLFDRWYSDNADKNYRITFGNLNLSVAIAAHELRQEDQSTHNS
jgi:hypothetical protein